MSHMILQKKATFAVIGTDARQVYLAQILAQTDAEVRVFGLPETRSAEVCCCNTLEETVADADIVLLPIPLFRDGLFHVTTQFVDAQTQKKSTVGLTLNADNLAALLPAHCHLFAGVIPDSFQTMAREKEIHCHDYLKSPSVCWKNTIATAEGMIAESIFRSKRTLKDSRCLVFGCGHCGSTLLSYLRQFDCITFAYDHDLDALAHASLFAEPIASMDLLTKQIGTFDIIFQTIPRFSIPFACASQIRPDTVFLDITSPPCTLESSTVTPVWLPALPGRLSPHTSAEILWNFIKQEVFYDTEL